MAEELLKQVKFGKRYTLQELYALVEKFAVKKKYKDWKKQVRALLEERNGKRQIGGHRVAYHGNAKYTIYK